ncbi:hypothetical protein BaRGS_00036250 [Batillaria attramentaria]|uniref:C2H2-type domain-containing protein n=1 Tax=Batillaria attramentaria TaxID=370345 RepID=A0ABD0JC32_9CAEN
MAESCQIKAMFEEFLKEHGKIGKNFVNFAKRDRIMNALRNPKSEKNAQFKQKVKLKKYRILRSEDTGDEYLAIAIEEENGQETLYRRVAFVEEYWDIIKTAHEENGHVAVKNTFRAITARYACLSISIVRKFIELCPVCSAAKPGVKNFQSPSSSATCTSTSAFMGTPSIAAMSDVIADFTVNHTPDAPQAHQFGETHTAVAALHTDVTDVSMLSTSTMDVIFSCHICGKQFKKKLPYQRHLRDHAEYSPSMPLPIADASAKKRIKTEQNRARVQLGRQRAVIIDVDMGIEGAQALMLAASRTDIDILGVLCVNGTVSTEHACNNVLRVLTACTRLDIPVFCGSEKPLVDERFQPTANLPGESWESSVDTRLIKGEQAVSALIRMVNEQPGKITLVCLGPLTNLALALRLDPKLSKKLKQVYILGGNIEGRGGSTLCAERNFHLDPEAAHIVLRECQNITLLPHEVCVRHILAPDFFDGLVHLGTEKSEFVRMSGDERWLTACRTNGCIATCCYAVAIVVDNTIAMETENVYATVELVGVYGRGMMVVDWNGSLGREPNMRIVRSLDLGKIQSLLVAMMN